MDTEAALQHKLAHVGQTKEAFAAAREEARVAEKEAAKRRRKRARRKAARADAL